MQAMSPTPVKSQGLPATKPEALTNRSVYPMMNVVAMTVTNSGTNSIRPPRVLAWIWDSIRFAKANLRRGSSAI